MDIIAYIPKNFDSMRFKFIINSFKKNNYNIKFYTLKNEKDYFSNCGGSAFMILETKKGKCFIDPFDRIFEFSELGAKECDWYFKINLCNSNTIQNIDKNSISGNYNFKDWNIFYEKYKHKLIPLNQTREQLLINKPIKLKKKYIISTYSMGHGDKSEYGKNRDNIYKIIKSVLGDKFNLKKADIYNYNLYSNSKPLSYNEYLKLLSESYFMIYFTGKGLGMPHRICDGYLSNCALLGEHIYTDAGSTFPILDFGWKLHENFLNEEETIKKLKHLMNNYEDIYSSYIHKQREWFEKNININTFYKQFIE